MQNITIIDYGVGNLRSVVRAFENQGATCTISGNPEDVAHSDCIVLPGQGAFGEAIGHLTQKNLTEPIQKHIQDGKPFFGICLGFQILFESSEEKGMHKGLGLFKGHVKKFPTEFAGETFRVPHVGWNTLTVLQDGIGLIPPKCDVYFIPSYYVETPENDLICTKTEYSFPFTSSIQKGNLFACQFHPEKSGKVGEILIRKFLGHVRRISS